MGPRARATPGPPSLVALPGFSCETTCFALSLMVVEVGATAAMFLLYGLSQLHQQLFMVCGIISLISVSGGLSSLCRSTPFVTASLALCITTTFAFILSGGICVISSLNVHSSVASYLNKFPMPISQSANKKLIRDTKVTLALAATVLFFSALCHAVHAHHLNKLVGPQRSTIIYLQAFSLLVIPFSLFLVVGGQYIADSGTLASAPYTSIIVFGCGVLLLSIAVLAFIGGSFEYRRLLSLCVMLSYVTASLMVGLSVTYLALRSRVEAYILLHWEALRIVLPPTFQARYDRDQFVELVQNNLVTVAYVGIVSGLFTFQTAGVCVELMNHTTMLKRQLAHDKQDIRRLEAQTNITDSDASVDGSGAVVKPVGEPQVAQRHEWRQYFETSKRRQRIAMRIFAFLFVAGVALILAVMCANVVFATKCHSIGKIVREDNYTIFTNEADQSNVSAIHITNRFTRGMLSIEAAQISNGTVALVQYGNAERNKDESYMQTIIGSTFAVVMNPIKVTRFLWLDGSCQRSVINVGIPVELVRELDVNSNTSVDIRGGIDGPSLPFSRLSVQTDQANLNVSQVLVMESGLFLHSASGEIGVTDLTVDGRGAVGIDTRAIAYSGLGSLRVSNATFLDCETALQTGAGTVELTQVYATATVGRGHILIASGSGTVYADVVRANWIEIKTTNGDVSASALRTTSSSAFMGRLDVTSVSGDVTLQQIDPHGSVHIETSSGNIKLQLQTMAFTGLYYLHSEYGNVTIRQGLYGTDTFKPMPVSAPTNGGRELQGGINCDPTTTSCLSYGDLYLYSRLGDVEVVLGCETFQCE